MCPVKEPNFFAAEGGRFRFTGPGVRWLEETSLTDEATYCASFDGVRGERAVGEVSPRYMVTPQAASRIAATIPEVKIVAVLRDPTERAFSSFVSLRRDGIEPEADFRTALADESRRLEIGWSLGRYVAAGLYAVQLEPYFSAFPKERIRIYLHDDLRDDPVELQHDLHRFLGVAPEPTVAEIPVFNRTGEIPNPLLGGIWRRTHELRARLRPFVPSGLRDATFEWLTSGGTRPAFDPALRAKLAESFRVDVERLERLIDRDLSHWL